MNTIHSQQITPEDQTRILDVRTRDEYLREHIPGSVNIPLDELATRSRELEGESWILSCQSGNRAQEAARILGGAENLHLLEGGLRGWKTAGKETRSLKGGISIMRQVQIIAGSLILIGALTPGLTWLAALVGAGLLIAGLSGTCMMASLLGRMPWNRGSSCPSQLS